MKNKLILNPTPIYIEPYGRVDRKENESSIKSTGLGLTFCKMAVTEQLA